MAGGPREPLHTMLHDLNDDDLEAAHHALRRMEAGQDCGPEQRFVEVLVDDGLLAGEPPPLSGSETRRTRDRPSMALDGQTIAETIIRERGRLRRYFMNSSALERLHRCSGIRGGIHV
ncbi:hypothetical protein HN371_09215 [Candidatus Poribacteria bacterium]|jgi:hypothetical protein|nr:hypothetical protein [Candidatus Poribacteria bacterium]MBT5534081.1 hypothetical protein [Candidatus Poribacteria bacterium]MBT5711940.1 hypothetical protein [Candidatus Poribacteria bacterium]MBT7098304.1 hypothetical protein [Candidatus Poribacteria bacterium]MBT7804454.1 hypothetical protein [Candidatus Poribacteria bacterium]